ncbi:uncharacterized protein LOC133386476 [Rhineura floridana]|uniref:uncharacterized protein LOC133386476 n=1 Tax=Rhineura floridana TaxID=261503 RepID=UPI002AC85431|nr:uncharacterized protein LOC133386476 [Rhineura floridana]
MAGELQLAFISWQSPKNNVQHHTAEMGTRQLVVRRGQPFTITLHFYSRGYQPGRDSLHLIAETGPQPEVQAGTRSIFPVGPGQPDSTGVWRAASVSSGPQATDVAVSAPAGAPIGRYRLKIRVDSAGRSSSFYYLGEFILLFNAWCPDDAVYLENELARQEYLLNEQGLIYQGNRNWIRSIPWNFGQFEEDIVGICLKLLDKSLHFLHDPAKDCSLRSSPVYVSRVLSAMINSNDDNGVLLGNWSEDYSGGVRPTEWSGSIAILTQWDRTGGQPVKYGQCWVFAAVMCTVMRCLGIPTRVVTNFDSGHEKDGNLIIDMFYDKTGRLLPTESSDSIWNFHVWNECWMARRDLPPGNDGWQVLDATPQERSNGLYCCGPAPVTAIREGDVHLRHDAPFVFSMVNADRVAWLLDGTKKEKLQWDTSAVGNNISTKRVGSDEREDITSTYKPLEGSLEERRVFLKALGHRQPLSAVRVRAGVLPAGFSTPADGSSLEPPVLAQTSLKLRLVESPEVGQDINLTLLACNLEPAYKELKLSLSAQPVLHNGSPLPPFWQDTLYLSLSPKEEKTIPWRISYEQYGKHLGEGKQFCVIALGEENTTWQKILAEKTITVASPTLLINVLAPVVVNQPFPLQVEFANPLSEPVGSCVLTMEGSGLVKGQPQIELGPLGPWKQASVRFQLIPYKSGLRQLQVTLKSGQFPPIKGHTQLQTPPALCSQPRFPLTSVARRPAATLGGIRGGEVIAMPRPGLSGAAALQVARCDLQPSRNNRAHRTAAVSTERLVVRRGQPYAITSHFSARCKETRDGGCARPRCSPRPGCEPCREQDVEPGAGSGEKEAGGGRARRELHRRQLLREGGGGQQPSQADGSVAQFPISWPDNPSGWKATVEAPEAVSWMLTVTSPANAAIGHYTLLLRVPGKGQRAQHPLGTFTLLFNPWCQGDSVFLPNEAERQEYVCNEDGTIYWGLEGGLRPVTVPIVAQTACRPVPSLARALLWQTHWGRQAGGQGFLFQPGGLLHSFQFEEDIVNLSLALPDISLLLLQDAARAQRSNPVHVGRLVSAMMNSNVHRAILEGCWMGDYSDGTPPSKWPGSAPILRQWLAVRCLPVHYGQCWVFAAVLCTGLRSLGIPTRVVTSFTSAQDTGGRLQVDEYFDGSGVLIRGSSMTTIWPFHAWNECWLARVDLPPGYDRWQALDATPQEEGSGSSCCGPAPVRAIKEGRLDLAYDVATFYVATNATCTAWILQENGDLEQAFSSIKYVGNNISTKGVGSERFEDLTQNYKYPDGSAAETAVLKKAGQTLEERRDQSRCVEDRPLLPPLALTPLAQEEELQHNGRALAQFWKEFHLILQAGMVPGRVAQFQPMEVEIHLRNPLPQPLTGHVVAVSGRGLVYKTKSYRLGAIEAGTTAALSVPFTPTQAGPRRLTVHLERGLLQPLKACRTIQVAAAQDLGEQQAPDEADWTTAAAPLPLKAPE